ncbi:MAG: hypothetical protein RBU27_14170 [Bacteroidota bacterium]|jgi:hypothetical protein|nr:hypothetical protein [Bacteroidota bacterium]
MLTAAPGHSMHVADRAMYCGSPEHKDIPSFCGQPRPRADATLCDNRLAVRQPMLQDWLRQAIAQGCCSQFGEDDFPKYVWFKDGDTVYEGRLVNSVQGEYKGYPLSPEEWPKGIEERYG